MTNLRWKDNLRIISKGSRKIPNFVAATLPFTWQRCLYVPTGSGRLSTWFTHHCRRFFCSCFYCGRIAFQQSSYFTISNLLSQLSTFFFHFQLPIRALCWTCSFIFWSTVNWCWAQLNNNSIENRYSRQSNGGIIIQNCKRQIWCSPSIIFLRNLLENQEIVFQNGVKSIHAAFHGARNFNLIL